MNGIPDISVIINAHAEGRLMSGSLRSAIAAIDRARSHSLQSELLIVLDDPDGATEAFCAEYLPLDSKIVRIRERDLGMARNAGVEAAHGTFVAFLDADDLWLDNWLTAAHAFIRRNENNRRLIVHPELVMYFEGRAAIWTLLDQDSPDFSPALLVEHNLWPALSFARTETLRETPFCQSNLAHGIGYEDWRFNCDTIAKQVVHKIVPGTLHALREKTWKRSLLKDTRAQDCVIGRTPLFMPAS